METAIALLSGGIDSPVAIHLMQDRLEIIAVCFHQVPLSGGEEIRKVREIAIVLGLKKLYLVPFTNVLKTLVENCRHKNYFVLQKIMMLKAAERIAGNEGAAYLITGENLGQVSSQTLQNLAVITKKVGMEILRPLLTYDKQEIVDKAKEIGTYEISKGPEICCLLGPKHPATRAAEKDISKDLGTLDIPFLIDESLKNAETVSL